MLPSKGNECNAAQAKITNLKKKKKREISIRDGNENRRFRSRFPWI